MAEIEGKAQAALEWAKGWPELDNLLKLNAIISEEGDASFDTSYNDVAVDKYNDGTAKRQYTFQVRVITAWSDGFDSVNIEAERLASSWFDWITKQYPDNVPDWKDANIIGIEPAQNAPALNRVFEADSLAEYLIQAVITYIE